MIGRTIKRLRVAREMTKSELARRAGVSATAVHNWEEYGTRPRPDTLPVIAAALHTTVTMLTGRNELGEAGGAPNTPREAAAAVADYKERIGSIFGVRPDQVVISINF